MAVQTGTTYTFNRKVTFNYQCSKCGTPNTGTGSLEHAVFTSALVRVNPRQEADQHFGYKISALNTDPVPGRVRDTSLPCSCAKCGHREPWGEDLPKKVSPHWLWFMAVTLIVSMLEIIPAGLPKVLCIFSGALPYLIIAIIRANKGSKRLKAIKALPAESLPVVY